MNSIAYFGGIAVRNLRRSGQRGLVALLCIAFGVMSLVAMVFLADALERTLILEPRAVMGGDISLERGNEESILPEHIAALNKMKAAGTLEEYTVLAISSSLLYRTQASNEMHFVDAGMGIDPATYPLYGAWTLSEPRGVDPRALVQNVGDVLVTRDVASDRNIKVGDELTLSDTGYGVPVQARVRGVLTDTPNHQGGKIYYSLATAKALGGVQALNTALVIAPNVAAARDALVNDGWSAITATATLENQRQAMDIMQLLLKGAGVLGLLVGGIGIANTMQVLLQRRRKEVAVFKTLGYRTNQLYVLFALEAAILGLVGSLLGAGLGALISDGLVNLFTRLTPVLISNTLELLPLLVSVLVGVAITVLFALWAIVRASRVQPMALLRNETVDLNQMPRGKAFLLAATLGALLAGVTSLILGSVVQGIGVVLFAVIGILVLGAIFGGAVRVLARGLPLGIIPLLRVSQNSLQRRGLSLIFAMIALFAGMVALGLGIVFTQNAQRALDERLVKFDGYNVAIVAPAEYEGKVKGALQNLSPENIAYGYDGTVRAVRGLGKTQGMQVAPVLIARSQLQDYLVTGAAWGSQPRGVYVFGSDGAVTGGKMEVELADGRVETLDVVGTFRFAPAGGGIRPARGLLMTPELFKELATPEMVTYMVRAPLGEVETQSEVLRAALPEATVMNLLAYAARFSQMYQNLFVFAVAMAGLALLAGVLLLANAVSLAMLDRRYEIGILKAIGYGRGQILVTLLTEYGLVALIASAAGLMGVWVFVRLISLQNPLAASLLQMNAGMVLTILSLGVGLTLATVLAVTWQPTRVSPVFVLNDRG